MSSRKRFSPFKTLAFRLTCWYCLVFTISCLVVFWGFYQFIQTTLRDRIDKELLAEATEITSRLAQKGMDAVRLGIREGARTASADQLLVRVLTPAGAEIAVSELPAWKEIDVNGDALRRIARGASHVFETRGLPSSPYSVRVFYGVIGPDRIVQLAKVLVGDQRFGDLLRQRLLALIGALTLLGALIGWFMAHRALSGIEAVSRAAEAIARGAMDQQVEVRSSSAEINRLASTFNHMVERIRSLICEMREMTDNVAHDLKSPLTRMRGMAEMTLGNGHCTGECASLAANTIEECDRLRHMIDTMLTVAELEAGAARVAFQEVDLSGVVEDACDLFQPVAEDRGVALRCASDGKSAVLGDLQQLQRLVANLLDNAIKHVTDKGTVTASIESSGDTLSLIVSDSGSGISPEEIPRIFDRFYRCDRSRSAAGFGLGLSLVRAIARFHGGDVAVTSVSGQGSAFTVRLPRSSAGS
jgi:heavy metal sensor kinase